MGFIAQLHVARESSHLQTHHLFNKLVYIFSLDAVLISTKYPFDMVFSF